MDSWTKAAKSVRTCDAFNVPLVTFVDVPGSCPGGQRARGDHPPRGRSCSTPTARPRCPGSR
ncbi:MAG: carboxyl transferase domain-containing protein [Microthrixaceae bacterium]